jgi:cyanophycinase
MPSKKTAKGTLIVIGGHEEKQQARTILEYVAEKASKGAGRLVIVTVATQKPESTAAQYQKLFEELGVPEVAVLDIRTREQARDEACAAVLDKADVVFFTGGDQLRITSQIGDSLVFQRMRDLYEAGCTIVGTSAGAAAMTETMLIGGANDESPRLSNLVMAPGLGFLPYCIVDSHFAQRGRMGRLLTAVTQNPRNLGLGIDEDTAVVVQNEAFMVLGSGAVYILDGQGIPYSSLSEKEPESVLSVFNLRLDVLSAGKHYDLAKRQPVPIEVPE